jgi:hypothetical protein
VTLHVAVDDATRRAYVEVLEDEKGPPRPPSFAAPSPSSAAMGVGTNS